MTSNYDISEGPAGPRKCWAAPQMRRLAASGAEVEGGITIDGVENLS